ncbi:carbohydrate kinase family protein [Frankia sp. CNm7]|uniref:Carbohydrate kinase family protein n=1 Tax=Frankia nepalensis TaxID=1836974 RepID=A0A937URZ4_9ACTN|nr:carbohydrate kinase family protein [Frankia nepalensis]MBL7502177.1 carbohydrate kinase family protein [Frankia nepalensis]MBL7510557.1 carbohydrate kinase family protein [Frankia nepalensis]MBL7518283.1 carbohydrate kinase family protein [Frankia nepalensis]MBL7633344.1 carbohydrate kinase family protein [Frankia nepalensis]
MTGTVVVAGVANVQQTVPVAGFPVVYEPVRYLPHGLRLEAAGVGLNVARTLRALGSPAVLATFVGGDPAGALVRAELDRVGLPGGAVLPSSGTPSSVVLVDPHGARQIHTDLKDVPDAEYPPSSFAELLAGARLAVLTTVGFARPLLPVAQAAGVPVAVDLQTITDPDDPYSQPWLKAADIVFCSAERLGTAPADVARAVLDRFPARIVVVGLGADGVLLATRDRPARRIPAVAPHGVIDTTGAGDALFAGFLHYWLAAGDADAAAEHAVVVAGCAVGTAGAASHVTAAHVAALLAATG